MVRGNYKKIINIGISTGLDGLEINRIQLINSLALFASVFSLLLSVVTLIEQLYNQSILILVGSALFATTFLFNYYKKHALGRSFFVASGSILVIYFSVHAYSKGLFTDTENLLFAFMAISILIFKGAARHYRYWVIFLILVYLKFYKLQFMGLSPDFSFYILIQNTAILAVLLYFFLLFFYKALEKSVRQTKDSERTLYNLIDNISIFIALFNPDGTYKIVNHHYEKALKVDRRKLIGKSAYDVFPKEIADWQTEVIATAIENKSSTKTKKSSILKDGSKFVGYGRANPILNKNGKVIAVAGYIDNITELELVKQKLDAVNKSKDQVLSILTHDLKSPLNTFESILNSTKYEIITSKNFDEFVGRLKKEFSPVKETINDLLFWANSNMNDLITNTKTFNTQSAIEEIILNCKALSGQKEIEIILEGRDIELSMDPDHFKIALRNLIQNAIKFSNQGGKITISQSCEGKDLLISINDVGIGMSQERIDKIIKGDILKPGLGTAGEKGTGIGLSMVSALLKKNNCKLDIQSTEGEGTTITLIWTC